jgi:sugar lactone lactonase YvrE
MAARIAAMACAGICGAAVMEAPLDVRKDAAAKFVTPPAVESAATGVKISFAVSAPTDVEVAILDAKGTVVRHLAAGLLGKHAPAPFAKDSLSQAVTWDRKDDAGKDAAGGPFQARVRAGATPQVDQIAGRDPLGMEGICALAVGKDGDLYALSSESYRGGTDLRVFNRDGKYLRTIMPYPSSVPKERLAAIGQLEIEGERLPMVHSGVGHLVYPLTDGMRQQNMLWHPSGYLVMVSAIGTMAQQGPPRYLLAVHPQGGAPDGVPFVGPQLRMGVERQIGGAGEGAVPLFDHLALSPDGSAIYVSVGKYSRFVKKGNGVLRLKWSDAGAGDFWLGGAEAGADDTHFNDPEGIATDAKGNLYVCDWGNNRVCIFTPDGKPAGRFTVEKPHQIAVHPASGEIYLLSCDLVPKWGRIVENTVVRKFSAFGSGEPRELAAWKEFAAKRDASLTCMALDAGATPPKLWAVVKGSSELLALTDKGSSFEAGAPLNNHNGVGAATFIAADPVKPRVLLYEGGEAIVQVDLATGKKAPFCKGADMAFDRDGTVYVMGGRDSTLYHFDADAKPLPFASTGKTKLATKGWRGFGPNMGMPGIAVGASGDIYIMRNSNYGTAQAYGNRVDVYAPDGTLKKESLIEGLGYGDCGLGVDAAGNVYVGSNIKPADKPFPEAFMGKVPAKSWLWWKGAEREAPWKYVYYNNYLFEWGAVLKFPPAGGAEYGQHPWNLTSKEYGAPKPTDSLANAPADATTYRSAYLGYDVKVAGALWRYPGCGIIPSSGDGLMPDPGCACRNSHLAADFYGRVFVPNPFRFCVEMLDTNGNLLSRIGRYGTQDEGGKDADVRFAWPCYLSTASGRLFVMDPVNRQIVVVKFAHAAEAMCAIK